MILRLNFSDMVNLFYDESQLSGSGVAILLDPGIWVSRRGVGHKLFLKK